MRDTSERFGGRNYRRNFLYMENISKLCEWYERHCVNDWHESYGITISNIDNPGWAFEVELNETELEDRTFDGLKIDRSEMDWIYAKKEGKNFVAAGGPRNLNEMIGIFLQWAE